jgi:hypothetical protein
MPSPLQKLLFTLVLAVITLNIVLFRFVLLEQGKRIFLFSTTTTPPPILWTDTTSTSINLHNETNNLAVVTITQPPTLPPTHFTIFTSTITIKHMELIVIKTWILDAGAYQVVVFVDDVQSSMLFLQTYLSLEILAKIQVRLNPGPHSLSSNKISLSSIMRIMEMEAVTYWLILLNSDIMLSARVRGIIERIDPTHAAAGMRLNIHVVHPDGFKNITTMEAAERMGHSPGWLYNPVAADFFIYPKNFWQARCKELGLDVWTALDFIFGEGQWDNGLIHIGRSHMCEVSSVFLAVHFTLTENGFERAPIRGWEQNGIRSGSKDALIKSLAINATQPGFALPRDIPDSVHNAYRVCANNFKPPAKNCFIKGSLRKCAYQLCPDGIERVMNESGSKNYGFAVHFIRKFTNVARPPRTITSDFMHSGEFGRLLGCEGSSGVWNTSFLAMGKA